MLASVRAQSCLSIAIVLGALAASACGSDPAGTGGGGTSSSSGSSTGGTGATGAASSSSSTGGSEPTCPPGPGYGGNEATIQVTSAEATIFDVNSAPIGDNDVQLCGLDLCLYGTTDANGHVLVPANKMLKAPAFKFGDGIKTAKLGIPLKKAVSVFPSLTTGVFPQAGVAMVAGMDATSGDVTLNIAAGVTIIVDTLTYDTPDRQKLRAVTIPTDKETAFLDPTLGIELLYGVAPVETIFCPAVGVTVPNAKAWAAGAAVEFYLHGVDVTQEWAPYGGWTKVSDGQVSADGVTISTAPGGGLPALSAFGIRLKP